MHRLVLLLFAGDALCYLWPNGVVHYDINTKDYDRRTQDDIEQVFGEIQNEVCLKFFHTPHQTASANNKVLYISNSENKKDCPPHNYDFNNSVVDMPLGYKCINKNDIARTVVDMLRATIENKEKLKFHKIIQLQYNVELQGDEVKTGLLSQKDRDYINNYYGNECRAQAGPIPQGNTEIESGPITLTEKNWAFYKDKLWPMGIVMFGVAPELSIADPDMMILQHAINAIERTTCIVFQQIPEPQELVSKNFLWFSKKGEDTPHLGFKEGNQTLSISFISGRAPGYTAAALAMLMRVLGIPMMSNRFDRNNYIEVMWKNVLPGKEYLLERAPEGAWIKQLPYDFTSASHAPANFMCRNCQTPLAHHTVTPLQDYLWQKMLAIGHRIDLSSADTQLVNVLYDSECVQRGAGFK